MLKVNNMVSYGYDKGFRAIKRQLIPAITETGVGDISKYTHDLLQRTCEGWMK